MACTAIIYYSINSIKFFKFKRKFKANKICFRWKMSIEIKTVLLNKLCKFFTDIFPVI